MYQSSNRPVLTNTMTECTKLSIFHMFLIQIDMMVLKSVSANEAKAADQLGLAENVELDDKEKELNSARNQSSILTGDTTDSFNVFNPNSSIGTEVEASNPESIITDFQHEDEDNVDVCKDPYYCEKGADHKFKYCFLKTALGNLCPTFCGFCRIPSKMLYFCHVFLNIYN